MTSDPLTAAAALPVVALGLWARLRGPAHWPGPVKAGLGLAAASAAYLLVGMTATAAATCRW